MYKLSKILFELKLYSSNMIFNGDLTADHPQLHIYLSARSLEVEGHLNLSNTETTWLPPNLKVGGNLYLSNTLITSLPNNLQVGEDLNLNYTQITSLPSNLQVGGKIYGFKGNPNKFKHQIIN